jgi:hypothetical protein
MGVSTDACLAYGVDFQDDPPWESTGEHNHEDDLARALGLVLPLGKEKFEYGEAERFLNEQGIGLVTHCSADYPMYFVFVPGTLEIALRGTPQEVKLDFVGDEAYNKFITAMEKIGVTQKPTWQIFSDWG